MELNKVSVIKNEKVQVPMDAETYKQLSSIATEQDKTVPAVIRTAVKLYLKVYFADKGEPKYRIDLFPGKELRFVNRKEGVK